MGYGRDRPQAAVIGSGIAGLSAAYVLQRTHDVSLFEADDRLGGHSHTHDVAGPTGSLLTIDSGFIVHNDRTYPTLLRLFDELDVPTHDTEMSMSVTCAGCGLEYAGAKGPRGFFAQPRNLLSPGFMGMLTEVTRFHRRARAFLYAAEPAEHGQPTLSDYLEQAGHSAMFTTHFMLPLVSTVWSVPASTALRYPARHLFRFLDNHGMLSVSSSPQWRTVVGGARTYVERAVKHLTAVRTSTPVRSVRRVTDGIEVHDDADDAARFDVGVVATHPDQALRLLPEPRVLERDVLGACHYSRHEVSLHTDARMLPRSRAARSSWNYLMPTCTPQTDTDGAIVVSYDMNRLQSLGAAAGDTNYVVSLDAGERVDPGSVIAEMTYEHPIYNHDSVAAQARMPELNADRLAFAGAWQGWGFHEDGCASGVRAAASLGTPW